MLMEIRIRESKERKIIVTRKNNPTVSMSTCSSPSQILGKVLIEGEKTLRSLNHLVLVPSRTINSLWSLGKRSSVPLLEVKSCCFSTTQGVIEMSPVASERPELCIQREAADLKIKLMSNMITCYNVVVPH